MDGEIVTTRGEQSVWETRGDRRTIVDQDSAMLSERCKVVRYTAVRTREAGSVLLEHSRMSMLFGAIALHTGM